ncbi:hypothetical protein Tco_0680792 [Tanacetum coccineum]|uniref:Uncharacterized protein n=1 Tax=Tanacetum coccineum TaxID=301880 RepID=A0ABQ4XMT0_9ASTR
MAAEAPSTIPLSTPEKGHNGSDPKEPLVDVNISDPASEDRTPDRSLENTSKDPVMQFVVQNFEQINVMYSTFSSKRKEMNPASAYNNNDHPVIEPWRPGRPPYSIHGNYGRAQAIGAGMMSFLSHYSEWGSSVLERRFQKTQAEILGIRQKYEESLKDYLARFGKETLHMTDRSDAMMIGAFISGLCPGRPFKDLIARPPTSLGDLYIHVNGCIRADEANNANRLRDTKE